MRIAHVIKGKNLTPGVRVLVINADEEPQWRRVVSCEQHYASSWYGVELEGTNEIQNVEANTRVVVWK
jgi:hypothetical protein